MAPSSNGGLAPRSCTYQASARPTTSSSVSRAISCAWVRGRSKVSIFASNRQQNSSWMQAPHRRPRRRSVATQRSLIWTYCVYCSPGAMIKLRFGVAIACLLTAGDCLVGQAADTARRAHGATVTRIVYDSIGRSTLGGAIAQLAAIAPTVTTLAGRTTADGGGRYTFTNVPPGRYAAGFLHPMLDSLGIESPLRPVEVTGDGTIRADVAIPGAARLRRAVCELAPGDDSSGVVLGFLRDARALTPVVDAPVTAQWLELVLGARG